MAVVSATRVEFCHTPGGHRVAYAQAGSGRPLVMLPGWLSHVEQLWTHPAAASARASAQKSVDEAAAEQADLESDAPIETST